MLSNTGLLDRPLSTTTTGKASTVKAGRQNKKVKFGSVAPVTPRPAFHQYGADVHKRIATRAHEIFERHGRVHGHDLDDWLQAEAEVLWEMH